MSAPLRVCVNKSWQKNPRHRHHHCSTTAAPGNDGPNHLRCWRFKHKHTEGKQYFELEAVAGTVGCRAKGEVPKRDPIDRLGTKKEFLLQFKQGLPQ